MCNSIQCDNSIHQHHRSLPRCWSETPSTDKYGWEALCSKSCPKEATFSLSDWADSVELGWILTKWCLVWWGSRFETRVKWRNTWLTACDLSERCRGYYVLHPRLQQSCCRSLGRPVFLQCYFLWTHAWMDPGHCCWWSWDGSTRDMAKL